MTQEEKDLLLKDLCARLPYGVNGLAYIVGEPCNTNTNIVGIINESIVTNYESPMLYIIDLDSKDITIKPYLRPMSSMNEEEFENLKEYSGLKYKQLDLASYQNGTYKCLDFYLSEVPSYVVILVFDWLNAHHIDYRGLIEKGLAIEAPEGMYN